MAKGDPKSVTVQYKVHLKPTEIGRLVIERLARPHLDVSPELRRFIELGYAAERAGFILDGTVLRHAGRAWETQPDVTVQPQPEAAPPDAKPAGAPERSPAPRVRKADSDTAEPGGNQVQPNAASEISEVTTTTTPSLKDKLRGLSG
jgi:hypothetical protein